MQNSQKRRSFLKSVVLGGTGAVISPEIIKAEEFTAEAKKNVQEKIPAASRKYNSSYTSEYLNRVAFPIGGLGAGMFCLEGTGAISHMSVRNKPDIFHGGMFAAMCIKGAKNGTKV